jgi:hypothetical protein
VALAVQLHVATDLDDGKNIFPRAARRLRQDIRRCRLTLGKQANQGAAETQVVVKQITLPGGATAEAAAPFFR